jgi:hypothetical protein
MRNSLVTCAYDFNIDELFSKCLWIPAMNVVPCLRALMLLGLCLSPFAIAHATPCHQYEPAESTLSGTLTRQVFPGPPSFEDVVTGDEPQVGFYLSLAEPLCMDGSENEADVSVEDGQTLVQLVLGAGDYDTLRPYLDQPVVLKGTLFGAVSGYHHTQVLLQQVEQVSGSAATPVDCSVVKQAAGNGQETYNPVLQGKIIGSKAWVYQAPHPACTDKRDSLAPGTAVSVSGIGTGGWVRANFTGSDGKEHSAWLDQAYVLIGGGDVED